MSAWWSFGASPAAASEEWPSDYEVPAECPGSETFQAEVGKRTNADKLPRGARVTIAKSVASGYRGRLHLEAGERDVEATTCLEVVQALALAVAMAADDERDESTSSSSVAVGTLAPAREAAPLAQAPRPHGTRAFSGLAFGGTGTVGHIAPSLELFAGLDWNGPALRVAASAARSGEVSTANGTARFERWAGRLEGCPLSLQLSTVRVAPCAGMEAGALVGSGASMLNAESRTLPWLALVSGARVEWDVSSRVFLEAEGRAVIPLLLHAFYVRPDELVFRPPGVAAEATLGVGYRFLK